MSPMATHIVRGVACLFVASGSLMVATGASAAVTGSPEQLKVVSSKTVTSSDCVSKVKAQGGSDRDAAVCSSTVTLAVGGESRPTPRDLLTARSTLSAQDFSALATAAAAGAVRTAPFQQGKNKVTDQEQQYGSVFYDGTRVWISTYRGDTGAHICKVDWSVGYSVTNTGCGDYGSSSQRGIYQKWMFAVGVKGSPVSWEETSTIYVNASGRFWQ